MKKRKMTVKRKMQLKSNSTSRPFLTFTNSGFNSSPRRKNLLTVSYRLSALVLSKSNALLDGANIRIFRITLTPSKNGTICRVMAGRNPSLFSLTPKAGLLIKKSKELKITASKLSLRAPSTNLRCSFRDSRVFLKSTGETSNSTSTSSLMKSSATQWILLNSPLTYSAITATSSEITFLSRLILVSSKLTPESSNRCLLLLLKTTSSRSRNSYLASKRNALISLVSGLRPLPELLRSL